MVTIRDVARSAGVSIATVSRVFNGSPSVSQETYRRVQNIATRLDYWPHSGARSLTTNRTHALGVLLPDLFGEFFSEVIRGIDHAARVEKLQILVSSSHANTQELIAAARSLRGRIDGLIAMVPDNGSASGILPIAQRFPVVLLNPRVEVSGCSTVSIANYEGACAVVEHLVSLGHRRIGILQGQRGNVDAEERLRGYRSALRAAGIRPDRRVEFQGDFTESSGFELAAQLLACNPRPTAVFAANDYMAIGLLRALRDAGVEVPADMALAGFDDIAFARYLHPPLTTVHVDAYALGERATRLLARDLRSERPGRRAHIVLPTTLVVRGSCGAAREDASEAGPSRRLRGFEPSVPTAKPLRRSSRKAATPSHPNTREEGPT